MNSAAPIRVSPVTRTLLPYAAMLGCMLLLPAGTSFAKQLFPHVGAAGTAFYRTGFGALVLLVLWRPWRRRWSRAELASVAGYGVALGGMGLCFYMALRTLPLGVTLAVEFLGPLSVAVFHSRRAVHFVWIGLAVFGLALLLPLGGTGERLDPTGLGFAIAGGTCWAAYIVLGARAAQVHSGYAVAIGLAVAAVVVAPFGIASGGIALLDPRWLAIGFVAALLSSVLPYSLEMVALKAIPKRVIGVLIAGEPAVGALVGMAFLHEAVTPRQWIAICCVVTAGVGSILAGDCASTPAAADTSAPANPPYPETK